MPPSASFRPHPCAPGPAPAAETVDTADGATPSCTLDLPQMTEPGLFCGSCPCGLVFAVTVRGEPGDTRQISFRCQGGLAPEPKEPPSGGLRWQPGLFR
jgi:hypothetical protein